LSFAATTVHGRPDPGASTVRRAVKVAILSPYPTFPFHEQLGCRVLSYQNNASWTVALANALAQIQDTEVHVVTESDNISRSQLLRRDNLTLHFIEAPERFKTLTLWYFDRRRLLRVLAEIRPDIVHGQGIENQYGDAAVRSPYPHLLTVHGVPALSNFVQRIWTRPGTVCFTSPTPCARRFLPPGRSNAKPT
jgi:hypothetical protein